MINLIEDDDSRILSCDRDAERTLKEIKKLTAEHDRIKAEADEEISEIVLRMERVEEAFNNRVLMLKTQLQNYILSKDEEELHITKTQSSYKMLHGTIVLKKAKQDIKKTDALVEWLKENNPEFVKVKAEPDWANYKKRLVIADDVVIDLKTGEVVEGVVVENVPEKIEVKI